MKYLSLLAVCLITLSACSPAPSSARQHFRQALELNASKPDAAVAEFARSGREFAAEIKAGRGDLGRVAFNASQAWHLAGDLDQARVYGLLARLGHPRDAKIGAWYQQLRHDTGADVQTENLGGWSLILWGRQLWNLGGCLLLVALLGVAAAAWFFQRHSAGLRLFAVVSAGVFGLLFLFAWTGKVVDSWQPVALTRGEIALHQGDSLGFAAIEPKLSAGTPVRILEVRVGWTRVHSAGGAEGWLPAESLSRIADVLP